MRSSPSLVIAFALASSLASGCSSSGGNVGLGADATSGDGAGGDSDLHFDSGASDGTSCATGSPCGDGGVCTAGACCPQGHACVDACCNAGDVCSFGRCMAPGAVCVDPSDCTSGQYCERAHPPIGTVSDAGVDAAASETSSSCVGGAAPITGRCISLPPTCAASGDAGVDAAPSADAGALTCLEKCEYHPPAFTSLSPVTKYSWGGEVTPPTSTDVMMTPIVVPLEDTNCDGKVDQSDVPDILVTSFTGGGYTVAGTLHALRVVGGALVERWHVDGVQPSSQLAAGNLDGKPGNEVIACFVDGSTHAFDASGKQLWVSPTVQCATPAIADVDGDGVVDVVVETEIVSGVTGTLEHKFPGGIGPFVISDIDGDGQLDVVVAAGAYHADGTRFVTPTFSFGGTFPAIGDFDRDGKPEIVADDYTTHSYFIWRYDAAAPGHAVVVRASTDVNGTLDATHCGGSVVGGGPVTVGDFNGDGTPDVALAGGIGYVVIDGKKAIDPTIAGPATLLWSSTTRDCSSAATGSTLFDFNGDGIAEVLYSDEIYFRIYDGPTGKVLFQTCNTTGTLIENPVVADVDNDGHADVVVVSNAYAWGCADDPSVRFSGVRVFSDPTGSWVHTRTIWNEHAYHVTNVNEDGTIPTHESPNWTQPGLNNFRQQKQPGAEFGVPDAVLALPLVCDGSGNVIVTVRNIGEATLPLGQTVTLFASADAGGTALGTQKTTRAIDPADSEDLTFAIPTTGLGPGVTSGSVAVYATIAVDPTVHECRTDNDSTPPAVLACSSIH
ncbi:MAG: FG-GAP repeat domain-containing protein [Polyangiales bacterium]